MNRMSILSVSIALFLTSLMVGPTIVTASSHCSNIYAIPIADTIYIDVHDYTPTPYDPLNGDPNHMSLVENPPQAESSEFHIYYESNGQPLLQRSELPTMTNFSDSYGAGCTGGDTLLF